MTRRLRHLVAAGAMAAAMIWGATPAKAGLYGHDFTADILFPTLDDVASHVGTAVAGPGVEFNYGDVLTIDLADTQIIVTFVTDVLFFDGSFSGFRFRDVDGSAGITGVSLASVTNVPGFDEGNFSLSGNDILVNFTDDGVGLNPGFPASIVLNVTTAALAVPEPASLALMGVGLAGLAAVRRRPVSWQA